jgi:hypothetical protein
MLISRSQGGLAHGVLGTGLGRMPVNMLSLRSRL